MSSRKDIAELETMTIGQLRQRYEKLFGEPCRSFNKQHLFRRCAWRIQALAEGDLSERAQHRAQHRARQLARDVDIRLRPPPHFGLPPAEEAVPADAAKRARLTRDGRLPMPGARLTRKYKGHVYQVEVLSNGFEYDGQAYRSLSAAR